MTNYDTALYTELKQLRLNLASQAGLPVYIVFSNRTLTHMAEVRPGKKEDFMNIHGIGPAKWEKYGQLFLDAITYYCIENAIAHGTATQKMRKRKEPTVGQKAHPDTTLLEKVREQLKSVVQILEELSSKLQSPAKT